MGSVWGESLRCTGAACALRAAVKTYCLRKPKSGPPSNQPSKIVSSCRIFDNKMHLCGAKITHSPPAPRPQGCIRRGGGGPGTQTFVYSFWPDKLFPNGKFRFPHYRRFGRGGGGGLLLWCAAILILTWNPPPIGACHRCWVATTPVYFLFWLGIHLRPGWAGTPPPPCPSYSRRRDRINLVPKGIRYKCSAAIGLVTNLPVT